jgi:16S rRNA processing protein RimM
MSQPERSILFARIGAAHGVRGEVRVKCFGQEPDSLKRYSPLAAADGRLFHVERLRPAKELLVVKLRGIDDRNAAEALNGVELYVDLHRLPPAEEDEFYHADLIGLPATTESGEVLGTVVAVQNFGAGDILEIAPSRGPSLLVPFTKAAVPLVDIAARRVVVAPPVEIDDEEPVNEGETG